jgi:hypothetical protein
MFVPLLEEHSLPLRHGILKAPEPECRIRELRLELSLAERTIKLRTRPVVETKNGEGIGQVSTVSRDLI